MIPPALTCPMSFQSASCRPVWQRLLPLCLPTIALLLCDPQSARAQLPVESFTEPFRRVDLAPAEPGTVATIQVREGDSVRKGQVLATLADGIHNRFGLDVTIVEDRLRIERPHAHEFVATLVEAFPGAIATISVGRPTLDDVFAHHAGMGLASAEEAATRS